MWSDVVAEDGDGLPVKAIVAGLVALYGAALAVGMADGVPSGLLHGRARAGQETGQFAVGGRDPAPPPVMRLCFGGPGGEVLGPATAGGTRVARATP